MTTPASRPWSVFSSHGEIDRYPGIENEEMSIVVFGSGEDDESGVRGETPEEALANARFLVLAVNHIEEFEAALRRVTETAEALIREVSDPGTEALAAVYCARQTLAKIAGAPK